MKANEVQKIREEVVRLKSQLLRGACSSQIAMETRCKEEAYNAVLGILDTMQEEPISEDLEEEIERYLKESLAVKFPTTDIKSIKADVRYTSRHFANWQKQQDNNDANHALVEQIKTQQMCYEKGMADMKQQMMKNLWKSADGDDLPEIDREVIALLLNGKVVFAHRPPEYWDGKDIVTDKVTRHYPKTYDKGGWNIPNVIYWLDTNLPYEENKLVIKED